jgi:DNA helicase-2/ATP-dependent DNA helicase PcrA
MNPQQAQAITAGDGPVLVLAGPGSGKTSVLTRRIAYLVSEKRVPPHRMMAVTFTNKAAGEMRERVERLLNDKLRGLQIGTFHATCARYLRMEAESIDYKPDYIIYDSDDQLNLIKATLNRLNIDSKKFNPRAVLGSISKAKNDMILPQDYPAMDYFSEIVKRVYEAYQHALRSANAMDFDDLLLNMVLLLRDNEVVREKYQQRFHYVLVDEFQDTNKVQYELVKYFAAPHNNVFVVGDEDQAIYAFRGADYRNVLRFRDSYPDPMVILLEQNYRSTQIILDVARAVIDHNRNRTPKALHTDKGSGQLVQLYEAYDERYEAEYVLQQIHELRMDEGYEYHDFAVMYRTNAQSRAIEQAFINASIPYTLVGGVGFYKRREVKDLLAYLRVVHNPDDDVSLERIINVPKRGIGKKSVQSFQDWVRQEQLTNAEAFRRLCEGEPTPLSNAARKKFTEFAELIYSLQEIVMTGNLLNLFDNITASLGYYLYLDDISKTPEEAVDRADNVKELRGLLMYATEYEQPLHEFLAEQSLVADVDSLKDDKNAVTLLTLHAAKGLEYPVVFITGVETGILPHMRSFDELEGIDEERRLFYVGVTRAKERLYLSYAFRRAMYTGSSKTEPSEFLGTIPVHLLDGSPTTLATVRSQHHVEQYRWESPIPRPTESRLQRDLREQTRDLHEQTRDLSEQSETRPKGNSKIRSKITPFPGFAKREKPKSKFQFGQRVRHPVFGEGKVLGVMRDMVDVMFDGQKLPKKILADAEGFVILD